MLNDYFSVIKLIYRRIEISFFNRFKLISNHLEPFLAVWSSLGLGLANPNQFGFWFGQKVPKPDQTKLPQH
jgi:hypothetical protein